MKNLKKPLAAFMAIALACVSCEVDNNTLLDESQNNTSTTLQEDGVTFLSEITTRATDTKFEDGDQISVTAYNSDGSRYQSNVTYNYSESKFYSNSPISYSDSNQQLSFRAVYPYIELSSTSEFDFEVKADQSVTGNYTASDLMSSYVSLTQSNSPTLYFSHLLSRIIVTITSTDVSLDDATATISAAQGLTYNLATSSYITNESSNTITMATNGINSYKAIIPPQNVEGGVTFGSIEVGGVDYSFSFDFGKILKAGMQYEFELTIKDQNINFISTTINDWEDGDSATQGEATFALADVSSTSYPTNTKKWIITDSVATATDMSGLRSALYNLRYSTSGKPMLEFPNLTSMPEDGLNNCDGFESISLPKATYIGEDAFYDCDYLTLVDAPKAIEVATYAFRYCTALTSVTLTAVETLGETAFYNCSTLSSIELPVATTVGAKAFYGSTKLMSASLPALTTLETSTFYGCSSLSSVSLPAVTTVETEAFYGCSSLTNLTLATTSTLTLFGDTNKDIFTNVDISNITLTVGDSVNVSSKALIAPVANNGTVIYQSFKEIIGGTQFTDVTPSLLADYSATNYPIYSDDWTINDSEAALAQFIGLNEALLAAEASGRSINLSFPNLDRFPSTALYIGDVAINSIDSISAPKATIVGTSAFYNSSITAFYLPLVNEVSSYAFYSCNNLTSIPLPEATSIGSNAFKYCTQLTNVSLPKDTLIGSYAFQECDNLTTLSLPEATTISSYAFDDCGKLATLSLPEATSIGDNAFSDCDNLTTLSLPKTTIINSSAFSSCNNLTSVSLPVATTIGDNAFSTCVNLTTLSLPEVTTIEYHAFNSCVQLTTLSLSKATTIGYYAFSGCDNLTTVSLPLAITISSNAFNSCDNLTTVSLPEATSIGYYAFRDCYNLTTVSLPKAATIGYNTFEDCTSLTDITLPAATSIASSLFTGCNKLQSVSIPAATTIESSAFYGCYMLYNLEVASNEGVVLTQFGTLSNNLLYGIDLSYMTLTTSSANSSMVNGLYFTAPVYESSNSYPDKTYGPFKEIVIVN